MQVDAKAFALQGLEAFHAIAGGHWQKGLQIITKAQNCDLRVILVVKTPTNTKIHQVCNQVGELFDCPGTGPQQGTLQLNHLVLDSFSNFHSDCRTLGLQVFSLNKASTS